MSLIADALKTAQRERERRASHEGPSASAVLIPLREPPRRLNPRRIVGLVAIGVVAIAAALIYRPRPDNAGRLVAPPLTSAILTEALAADSGMPERAPTNPRPTTRGAGAPQRTRAFAPATTNSVVVRHDSTAVLQGQPDTSRGAPGAVARTDGELRVAVDAGPAASRLFSQAVTAHRAGQIASARTLYQRVLDVEPDHADALNNLAVILSGQGEIERALEMMRRASALAPGNASVWNNIGTALREQGGDRSSEAIAAFRRALSIDPRHEGARVGLAQQYLAISALDDARLLLEQVLAANPGLAEGHYTLGQVLERQGDRPGALRAYSTFVNVAPPRLAEHAERVRQYIETLSR